MCLPVNSVSRRVPRHTGVCEQKPSSGEEDPLESRLSELQHWGPASSFAAGLQGRGSHKKEVSFTDTGMKYQIPHGSTESAAELVTSSAPGLLDLIQLI